MGQIIFKILFGFFTKRPIFTYYDLLYHRDGYIYIYHLHHDAKIIIWMWIKTGLNSNSPQRRSTIQTIFDKQKQANKGGFGIIMY